MDNLIRFNLSPISDESSPEESPPPKTWKNTQTKITTDIQRKSQLCKVKRSDKHKSILKVSQSASEFTRNDGWDGGLLIVEILLADEQYAVDLHLMCDKSIQ